MHWIRSHLALAPLPGRFVSVHLVDQDDPGRDEVEAFIARVYRDRHGAVLRSFFPRLLAYRDSEGRLAAAVGIRAGGEGPLFVEHYLDVPVEQAMSQQRIVAVDRSRVVEVGNFAATSPGIARELILQLAMTLQAAGMEWVLLVATQQLRNAFERLHLPMLDLAEARADRLGDAGADWGRYYASRPRLICGNLAEGVAYLRGMQRPPACDAPALCLAGAP
ncbi:thermostable hemolysin [Pseudoxanthomonas japonensis]|uniref:Thermostable hemolysin n=1 Tax=Pseudoxanthomonas japonensis TaxID=69284 RepID=A0ABQ6ZFU1_9GAMM|nr:thermostable hemolysin [Pseudoxanthomonas japonensis]KAF1724452.1 thermostable hemolysin [Pseudoxanthomonas japonensis]PZQ29997.1 MAG: thermostable hemolysin [Stenotrophomonas acidaminiphila]